MEWCSVCNRIFFSIFGYEDHLVENEGCPEGKMPKQMEFEFKKESIVKDVGKIFSRILDGKLLYHPIYEFDGKVKIDWEKEVE